MSYNESNDVKTVYFNLIKDVIGLKNSDWRLREVYTSENEVELVFSRVDVDKGELLRDLIKPYQLKGFEISVDASDFYSLVRNKCQINMDKLEKNQITNNVHFSYSDISDLHELKEIL